MGRRILITGVSRFLGSHLAKVLEADPSVEAVFGVDLAAPAIELERTEFIRADIRNPLIVKVLTSTGVDTVVHAAVIATPAGVGGRASMKEINVIGTMQLFAACQKAPALRQVVMKSTTSVYGSDPTDPAIFTEAMGPASEPKTGYARDAWEVENAARAFARRRRRVGHGAAVQPGDVAQQGRERRRRGGHQVGDRHRSAAGLDEALAQVHEMTLDLRLACAAEILARDRHAVERVGPVDALVPADDLAVLQRERVERAVELGRGKNERRRDAPAPPSRRLARARLEIVDGDVGDEGEAGEERAAMAVEVGAVGDDRAKAFAEDVPQVGDEVERR